MLYKDEVWDEKRFEVMELWKRRYILFNGRRVKVKVRVEVKFDKMFKKWS